MHKKNPRTGICLLTPQDIDKIFRELEKQNPNPRTELKYTNNYTLLVSVVLSAQATDKGVNKATDSLFKTADSPEKMLELGEEGLKQYIKSIGLFNNKAQNIIKLSGQLVELHNSQVPDSRIDLEKLAGVGRKTANVVLNAAFGRPTIAIDTHIFRVANRIGIAVANTPEKVETILNKVIPSKWKQNAHHWLILHGRYVCKARKPLCDTCKLNKVCKLVA